MGIDWLRDMSTFSVLNPDARPRERLLSLGSQALSDAELLAIILGSGMRGASVLDLALVDLRAEWVAGEGGWESRSECCCFAGRRLTGRVRMTLCEGAVAYRELAKEVLSHGSSQ